MRSFRDIESGQKLFSKFVFGLVCIWVLLACISRESTLVFGNSKELQQSIEFTWLIIQRRIVVLCKNS
jgi:hypothetical protein